MHADELIPMLSAGDRDIKDLAIYVGVPYCAYKCHFCDWVTDVPVSTLRSPSSQRVGYLAALQRQIRHLGPALTAAGYRPKHVYWGGGTPTRLEVDELDAIATAMHDVFDLSTVEHWSVETTPNDLDAAKLQALVRQGANRVSVGAQSFDAEQLRASGRGHTPAMAEAAIALLHDGGLRTFNVDMMTGFPEESPAVLEASFRRLVQLEPPHVTVYPFRASARTVSLERINQGRLPAPPLNWQIEAYERATDILRDAGYLPGRFYGSWRRHADNEDKDGNYKYNLEGDKIGFGSGADSSIAGMVLWNQHQYMDQYIADPLQFSYGQRFTLDAPQMFLNFIAAGLMTPDGLRADRFERLTGVRLQSVLETAFMTDALAHLERCGASLHRSAERLYFDHEAIHRVFITHEWYEFAANAMA